MKKATTFPPFGSTGKMRWISAANSRKHERRAGRMARGVGIHTPDRSGMGTCLPGGHGDEVQFRRRQVEAR